MTTFRKNAEGEIEKVDVVEDGHIESLIKTLGEEIAYLQNIVAEKTALKAAYEQNLIGIKE